MRNDDEQKMCCAECGVKAQIASSQHSNFHVFLLLFMAFNNHTFFDGDAENKEHSIGLHLSDEIKNERVKGLIRPPSRLPGQSRSLCFHRRRKFACFPLKSTLN
jgi:hypothetical protein